MRRFLPLGAVVLGLLAAAATTWAVTSSRPPLGSTLGGTAVLGAPKTALRTPACPSGVQPKNCLIVMTRTTAIQTMTDGVTSPMKIHHSGEVVAFTVGLAQLSTNATTQAGFIKNLNATYGGAPAAQLTILKPAANHRWTVVAEGPLMKLQPYLGYVVQFALTKPIPVKAGESVGLTVPTWAPVLSYNLNSSLYAYRQSRRFNCGKPGAQQNAQLTVGGSALYGCNYPGTRVEYGATALSNPITPRTTTTK
jgi:hypothetical protein